MIVSVQGACFDQVMMFEVQSVGNLIASWTDAYTEYSLSEIEIVYCRLVWQGNGTE